LPPMEKRPVPPLLRVSKGFRPSAEEGLTTQGLEGGAGMTEA
jgi:hypothetical protein